MPSEKTTKFRENVYKGLVVSHNVLACIFNIEM